MKNLDRMKLIMLAAKDLEEAVMECAKAKGDKRFAWSGYDGPKHYSPESIRRRIVQLRQDLLMLEKEL